MKRFIELSKQFFAEQDGKIKEVCSVKRRNIEILSNDDMVDVCCIYVEFENRNIFGNTTYMDAYRRYRQMRNDWWNFLDRNGYSQWDKGTKVIGHFVPLLAKENKTAEAYPVQESTSYGENLIRFDDLTEQNRYYQDIHQKYGIEWILEDGNHIAIGPDVGLFSGMVAYTKAFGKVPSFLDVGTGTGELSAYLIKNKLVEQITANEISEALEEHITTYLSSLNTDHAVQITYQFKNALEMSLPDTIDLLSLGIYYGAQPDYFKIYGKEIQRKLSENGAVIIQSGMLEGKFNVASVVGDNERLYDWDWYTKENTLKEYFTCIDSVFVADEVVTIATNSQNVMDKMKDVLNKELGATELPELKKVEL